MSDDKSFVGIEVVPVIEFRPLVAAEIARLTARGDRDG